jgi:predicted amidophosphoribosyltransferase
MQSALRLIFPPQCVSCGSLVEEAFTLCGTCWRDTPFISGNVCDQCGTPLPGVSSGGSERCDDCLTIKRPWNNGRAALIYRGNARRIVLGLKHGDRLDLAKPAAQWMLAAAKPLLLPDMPPDMSIVPIPVYWQRLLKRRYNQAAVLSQRIASSLSLKFEPDAIVRVRKTAVHDGMGREERFANMSDAIQPHPRKPRALAGKRVILVDDVMTSGATLAAATDACHASGAIHVSVLILARVAKDT